MAIADHVRFITLLFIALVGTPLAEAQTHKTVIRPGAVWLDTDGKPINAHGGGMLYHQGRYYWFGEHKAERTHNALVGITCYSSDDLLQWKNEGVALSVSDDPHSPLVRGCVMERPKVIYHAQHKQFVMYFHLELRHRGYDAAYYGLAVSDSVTGPYRFLRCGRVNPEKWPENMSVKDSHVPAYSEKLEWWTPEWYQAVREGCFVTRDWAQGQMSRDMTLFVDDDGKAYHVYASEDNLTLHIAELSDDYLSHTGRYVRVDPAGHNEAPTVFKKDGRYFMICSGCTGWEPNAARLLVATHIMGPWERLDNPCRGKGSERTFHSQGTFVLPVQGKKDAFIFMADRWNPHRPIDGRYVWLPIAFDQDLPYLEWHDEWDLDVF